VSPSFYLPSIAVAGGALTVLLALPGVGLWAARSLAWVFCGSVATVFALYCLAFFALFWLAVLAFAWVFRWVIVLLIGVDLLVDGGQS
jgi:hypothetical protein